MCEWVHTGAFGWCWECCGCHEINVGDTCRKCGKTLCPTPAEYRGKLLIIGCARSGTRYIAKVLKAMGAKFGHEALEADGMASSFATLDPSGPHLDDQGKWAMVRHADFDHVIHQVRHPLATIRSWLKHREWLSPQQVAQIESHTSCRADMSPLAFGARYWLAWNRLAEVASSMTYRVEGIGWNYATKNLVNPTRELRRLATFVGQPVTMPAFAVSQRENATVNRAPPVTWEDLEGLGQGLARKIREQAERYGYKCA